MFAALHVPDFPAAAILRERPDLRTTPCAVLDGANTEEAKGKLPLSAINRAARFAGLHAGWPLNRALVRCPDLRILPRDPSAEASLLNNLVILAESLTPDMEITTSDTVTLDLSGRKNAAAVLHPAPFLSGAELWHALAGTPDLAFLAARHESAQGRRIAPADLSEAPLGMLHTLAAGSPALPVLDLWGLRTLGDFMALPRQAIIERLGPDAGQWHDILHGRHRRLLRLHRPPESMAQRIEFDEALTSLEPLVFTLKRLLHTLTGRLAARHLAASSLDFRLILESGDEARRHIQLPEPRNTVEGMLDPLMAWLDSLRLDAAITALELDATTTFATAAQREWFGRQLPQPERWVETLAKLEGLLGSGRVGIPLPPACHAPDAFELRPALGATVSRTEIQPLPACPLPLHRYRPPREVAVAHELRGHQPRPLAILTGPHTGRILATRGPYPSSGSWWEPVEAWQRLEWDIQSADHRLLRLVHQIPDHWLLDGIYQ